MGSKRLKRRLREEITELREDVHWIIDRVVGSSEQVAKEAGALVQIVQQAIKTLEDRYARYSVVAEALQRRLDGLDALNISLADLQERGDARSEQLHKIASRIQSFESLIHTRLGVVEGQVSRLDTIGESFGALLRVATRDGLDALNGSLADLQERDDARSEQLNDHFGQLHKRLDAIHESAQRLFGVSQPSQAQPSPPSQHRDFTFGINVSADRAMLHHLREFLRNAQAASPAERQEVLNALAEASCSSDEAGKTWTLGELYTYTIRALLLDQPQL